MAYYSVLLPLALILFLSKALTMVCKRIGLPQVVGMLVAGVLIGLISYIPNQSILNQNTISGLGFIAKIGVILIMFSAGLETDTKQIRAVGLPAVIITLAGVLVPVAGGFVVAALFNGGFSNMSTEQVYSNIFYGIILSATSVSVTVSVLKELGKLQGKIGSTIVAAAILDDIIGVVALSLVLSLSESSAGGVADTAGIARVVVMTILFFVAAFVIGTLCNKLFMWLEKKFPHHRRLPIWGLALCFLFSYGSEAWFGISDITGAFVAGMVLARNPEVEYIDRKADIMSYMIFAPVFFANIGLTTQFSGIDTNYLYFGLAFVAVALLTKVIGCGTASLCVRYSPRDSLRVGIGMMARAEVMLVCAQKGVEHGLISSSIMPFILMVIIISSFVTPIVLKLTYRKEMQLHSDMLMNSSNNT